MTKKSELRRQLKDAHAFAMHVLRESDRNAERLAAVLEYLDETNPALAVRARLAAGIESNG